jgi:DNA polymerase III gamma/tau subunit
MGNADQVDASSEIRAQMAQHAQAFPVNELMRVIRAFNHAANDARSNWQPALPLELAFIDSLEKKTEVEAQHQVVDSPTKKATPPRATPEISKEVVIPQAASSPREMPVPAETAADPLPNSVIKHWREIITLVRQRNPQTQALLNSCKPLGVKNGALILGFNGEFAKSKMEQGDNLEIIQQVMVQVLGEALPIRCVLSVGGELPDDIDHDGMVASALRDLGGEIVDVQ